MIYDKLPIVLLSTIAAEKEGSTNSVIARFILNNTDTVQNMGIKDIADMCHVGTASISRFCKEIGLEGFAELRELLAAHSDNAENSPEDYLTRVTESLRCCDDSMEKALLEELCRDISSYQKISAFGHLKAETAAICFQADMQSLGKEVYTNISFSEQINHIQSSGKDELIIIFSYTGTYFDGCGVQLSWAKGSRPKIWVIRGGNNKLPPFVSKSISFSSDAALEGHPYQLIYAEGKLFRQYCESYRK